MTKEPKMEDNKQLELVGGEIVATDGQRPKYYLSAAAIEQRREAGKNSVIAKLNNTERISMLEACGKMGLTANANDPEDLLNHFHAYLEMCAEQGWRVGNMTAYLAMGVSRWQIDNWCDQRFKKSDPRFKQLADYVKAVCAANREQLGLEGAVHPALTIFWQRNFDGFTNEDIVRVETSDALGERVDAKQIAEKYKDIPDD
jgi:hypothetical protein